MIYYEGGDLTAVRCCLYRRAGRRAQPVWLQAVGGSLCGLAPVISDKKRITSALAWRCAIQIDSLYLYLYFLRRERKGKGRKEEEQEEQKKGGKERTVGGEGGKSEELKKEEESEGEEVEGRRKRGEKEKEKNKKGRIRGEKRKKEVEKKRRNRMRKKKNKKNEKGRIKKEGFVWTKVRCLRAHTLWGALTASVKPSMKTKTINLFTCYVCDDITE